MTEKNELEELPFCECGCGERVTKIGNKFVNGHHVRVNPPIMKGKVPWNKGLTKETSDSVKNTSEKLTGHKAWNKDLTKETHRGVKSQSEKMKGRTKETHLGVKIISEKLKGRTKETDEGRRRQSEKMRGRTKETDESVRRGAEKRTGRTKETHPGVKRQAEKMTGWKGWNIGLTKETNRSLKKQSEKMTGKLSPTWKGGISFLPYCDKFNENLKERVRDYFGRCCYLCGKNEAGNGRKLSVHHVNYNKLVCCEEEIRPLFVPLCMSCHSKVHTNREEWEELFTVSLDYLTDGECFIHKTEEMGGEMIK